MPYSIEFSVNAREEFEGLEKSIQQRIVQRLKHASEIPSHFMERLSGAGAWKLRVGDYRLVCDIHEKDKTIIVFRVGHRKNVYKRR